MSFRKSFGSLGLAVFKTVKPIQKTFVHNARLLQHSARCLTAFDLIEKPPPGITAVTMVPGDGVGPELMVSVHDIFEAASVPVVFEEIPLSEVNRGQSRNLKPVVESFMRNGVGIKGNLTSPAKYQGGVLQTLNLRMRRQLDLFANVVLVRSLPGFTTRHNNVDLVVIREQTEGEYSSLEHESVKGVIESMKIVTRKNTERIAKFAFDYALRHNRKKVTAVHKANIMKLGDGLFLKTCQEISMLYPTIRFEAMIIDNCCMQLVSRPDQFDVMVMGNLYGNIVDNVAAGLVGGAGVVPGESYSREIAVFEPGARHSFTEALGKDIANPTAIILSAVYMLKHIGLRYHSDVIKTSLLKVIGEGKVRTKDMGGSASSKEFTRAVIEQLH